MSKRDYEKRMKEDQEAAAHVFQDFINTFQNNSLASANKTFVRSGVLYSENQDIDKVGQIYNPKPLIKHNKANEVNSAIECAKILKEVSLEKSKKQEKPKSNLDLLKEELKQRHSERNEKERLKEEYDLNPSNSTYFEGGDPNSTNLFLTNLSPKITENLLMLEFGAYGPLASVKIMWPRGDEKARNSNCGFVAFMSRKDAERAVRENKHRDEMRVGWGKSVELPPHPIYVPDELLRLYLPPPSSGLPFNAQPPVGLTRNADEEVTEDFLFNCSVKVTVPLNKKQLMLVHRMVEFVVREGPMFEAFIMNKEIRNPDFNFLFDCQSAIHVYYRWKIFSILNGDSQKSWSMKPFRMFKGGSVWLPPVAPDYTLGMPDELINKKKSGSSNKLSESQASRLIGMIRCLTMNRKSIADATMFCMNHKNSLDDSVEIVMDSLKNNETRPLKKIARFYLLSDLLSNCKSKRIRLNLEQQETNLSEVFKSVHDCYKKLHTEHDRNNFKTRVLRVIKHWDIYKISSINFIKKGESLFSDGKVNEDDDNSSIDEPLDGASLLKRSMNKEIGPEVVTTNSMGAKKIEEKVNMEYFVPSKWDTVDPEEVEAQAMSTEKMYYMELENQLKDMYKSKKKKRRH